MSWAVWLCGFASAPKIKDHRKDGVELRWEGAKLGIWMMMMVKCIIDCWTVVSRLLGERYFRRETGIKREGFAEVCLYTSLLFGFGRLKGTKTRTNVRTRRLKGTANGAVVFVLRISAVPVALIRKSQQRHAMARRATTWKPKRRRFRIHAVVWLCCPLHRQSGRYHHYLNGHAESAE
jgi:hypothetical protein